MGCFSDHVAVFGEISLIFPHNANKKGGFLQSARFCIDKSSIIQDNNYKSLPSGRQEIKIAIIKQKEEGI